MEYNNNRIFELNDIELRYCNFAGREGRYLKSIELIIDEDPIVKRYNARRAKAEDEYVPF